jgi:uncharacterized membrane protein
MPISCPDCATAMPDDAGFCPGCGRAMRPSERAHGLVGVLPQTIAGSLAYFLLPAIAFLFLEPYKRNRFVRFHSFQCLGVTLAVVIAGAALRIFALIVFFIPVLGQLLVWLVTMLVSLGWFMVWVVLVIKAMQGEMFKLPVIGKFAGQQAERAQGM